jgi:hypothetical protein
MASETRLNGIQMLRGLAAFAVVIYHIQLLAEKNGITSQIIVNNISKNLYVGVDIFFVISGFIMAKTVVGSDISGLEFMRRRILRIVPLYWVLTFFLFISINVISNVIQISSYSFRQLLASLFFSSRIFHMSVPIIDQGWTLEFEMFFYILISICLIFTRKRNALMLTGVTLILICLLGANQMFLEFVIGITVYFINKFVYLKEFLFKFIAIFAVLIFLLLFSMDYSSDFRVVIYGIPCALMLLACANINLAPSNRLVVLGEISYSLYLSQSLLLFWFVKGSVLITNQLLQFFCLFILIPISCVVIAFFIHKFIEIPLTNLAKNYFFR